jgi:hypothetical protein
MNFHSWTHENPYEVAGYYIQHQFLVNMWCGALDNNLIGSHVIEGHLPASYYWNFLENKLLLHLGDEKQ